MGMEAASGPIGPAGTTAREHRRTALAFPAHDRVRTKLRNNESGRPLLEVYKRACPAVAKLFCR